MSGLPPDQFLALTNAYLRAGSPLLDSLPKLQAFLATLNLDVSTDAVASAVTSTNVAWPRGSALSLDALAAVYRHLAAAAKAAAAASAQATTTAGDYEDFFAALGGGPHGSGTVSTAAMLHHVDETLGVAAAPPLTALPPTLTFRDFLLLLSNLPATHKPTVLTGLSLNTPLDADAFAAPTVAPFPLPLTSAARALQVAAAGAAAAAGTAALEASANSGTSVGATAALAAAQAAAAHAAALSSTGGSGAGLGTLAGTGDIAGDVALTGVEEPSAAGSSVPAPAGVGASGTNIVVPPDGASPAEGGGLTAAVEGSVTAAAGGRVLGGGTCFLGSGAAHSSPGADSTRLRAVLRRQLVALRDLSRLPVVSPSPVRRRPPRAVVDHLHAVSLGFRSTLPSAAARRHLPSVATAGVSYVAADESAASATRADSVSHTGSRLGAAPRQAVSASPASQTREMSISRSDHTYSPAAVAAPDARAVLQGGGIPANGKSGGGQSSAVSTTASAAAVALGMSGSSAHVGMGLAPAFSAAVSSRSATANGIPVPGGPPSRNGHASSGPSRSGSEPRRNSAARSLSIARGATDGSLAARRSRRSSASTRGAIPSLAGLPPPDPSRGQALAAAGVPPSLQELAQAAASRSHGSVSPTLEGFSWHASSTRKAAATSSPTAARRNSRSAALYLKPALLSRSGPAGGGVVHPPSTSAVDWPAGAAPHGQSHASVGATRSLAASQGWPGVGGTGVREAGESAADFSGCLLPAVDANAIMTDGRAARLLKPSSAGIRGMTSQYAAQLRRSQRSRVAASRNANHRTGNVDGPASLTGNASSTLSPSGDTRFPTTRGYSHARGRSGAPHAAEEMSDRLIREISRAATQGL
eukprot:TRINITY_DN33677_c0_g1_i1.p1 TRINITY_DN33677_c0_g1~~TRINITY_DN33677_c0_g1_i1.p1  ORF type:complete len:870 (-),score=54.97 TRINITY_DN33677_c0_g1_i1:352-2961(-)